MYDSGKAAGRQEHIDEGYIYKEADITHARSAGLAEGWQAHIDAGYQYTANDVTNAYYSGLNLGHLDFMYVGDGEGDYVFVGGL